MLTGYLVTGLVLCVWEFVFWICIFDFVFLTLRYWLDIKLLVLYFVFGNLCFEFVFLTLCFWLCVIDWISSYWSCTLCFDFVFLTLCYGLEIEWLVLYFVLIVLILFLLYFIWSWTETQWHYYNHLDVEKFGSRAKKDWAGSRYCLCIVLSWICINSSILSQTSQKWGKKYRQSSFTMRWFDVNVSYTWGKYWLDIKWLVLYFVLTPTQFLWHRIGWKQSNVGGAIDNIYIKVQA